MQKIPSHIFQCRLSSSIGIIVLFVLVGIICQTTVGEWKAIDRPCLCQQFRCNSSSVSLCLHAERVCDGKRDCPDGEDELNKLTSDPQGRCNRQEQKKTKCSDKEFRCKFGGCILYEQVCDGRIDCWGAVDEATDFCTWVHSPDNVTSTTTNTNE